ncbi:GNAT family N-acetyltransferase [Pyxidicoccus xibeiensis]|uniref:GNAT family N-acetyltransferase n=1 Tax=Pyxidicoccus xibeiensis TaxID=2906759 RepID=UPI0020A83485|nr:GNAT family N-acetyltransferase [Pyxidicoccus xibeiensis]MCP3136182.1 GNAT family N-acetyltransferase [Pyxidicoccus xibeiensis]
MRERQLIPIEVAGSAVSGAVDLLLEDPDIAEVFWWWRPELGKRPPGLWSAAEGTRLFAVAEKGNGIIGLAALSNIHREERYARLSCAVAAPYRLAGAGHWATAETVRRGVRLDGLRHLETSVRSSNDTARRVLESLGFRALGTPAFPGTEAAPGSHVYLRLDLPSDPKGHFLMAPGGAVKAPARAALCA